MFLIHCKDLDKDTLILSMKNFQKVCEVPTKLHVLVKQDTDTEPDNFHELQIF
jgi:hypothetical protein